LLVRGTPEDLQRLEAAIGDVEAAANARQIEQQPGDDLTVDVELAPEAASS
jgi:hypothetical protein